MAYARNIVLLAIAAACFAACEGSEPVTGGTGGSGAQPAGGGGDGGLGGTSAGGMGGSGGMAGGGGAGGQLEPYGLTCTWSIERDGLSRPRVTTDASGDIYVTGWEDTSVTELVVKYDGNGTVLWTYDTTGAGSARSNALVVDGSGNTFIAGELTGAVNFGGTTFDVGGGEGGFVAKLDPAGNHVYSVGLTGTDLARIAGVGIDGQGNAYIAGWFLGTADFGGNQLVEVGSHDIVTAKLDPAGNVLWTQHHASTDTEAPTAIAVAPNGDFVVAGSLHGSQLDFGQGALPYAGSIDIFVAKMNSAGVPQWSKSFGDDEWQPGAQVALSAQGDIALAGSGQGSVDFGGGPLPGADYGSAYVAVLDGDGNHRYSHGYINDSMPLQGVAFDGAGNLFVTGDFDDPMTIAGKDLAVA
ncbi:MAG: hypothetical protein JRI68_02770, partial [Deltaproteobacteria bacterium]|nr:hypothetical protein [Deltaproteobacteria bacterium]